MECRWVVVEDGRGMQGKEGYIILYHNLSSALVNFSLLTGSEEVISKA